MRGKSLYISMIEQPSQFLKNFAIDLGILEMVMFVSSVIATGLAQKWLSIEWNGHPPTWVMVAVLPLVGPVFEKIPSPLPFLFWAWRRTRERGENLLSADYWRNVSAIMKEREYFRLMRADILYHDKAYWLTMAGITAFFPPSNPWVSIVQTFGGFWIAVLLAAALEYAWVEYGKLPALLRKLRKSGMAVEHYMELRLFARLESSGPNAIGELVDRIASRCELTVKKSRLRYCDYQVSKTKPPLEKMNDWESFLQVRRATLPDNGSGKSEKCCLQLILFRRQMLDVSTLYGTGLIVIDKIKAEVALPELNVEAVKHALLGVGIKCPDLELTPLLTYERSYAANPAALSATVDVLNETEVADTNTDRTAIVELKFWLGQIEHLPAAFAAVVMATQQCVPTTFARGLGLSEYTNLRRVFGAEKPQTSVSS